MKTSITTVLSTSLLLVPVIALADPADDPTLLSRKSVTTPAQVKPWTVWVLGPLSLENRLGEDSRLSLAAGFAGVIVDDRGSQGVDLGWMVEGQMFKDPAQQGYSFGLRAGSALSGVYFAPIFSYTSRPEKKPCFRASLLAPIGNNVSPFSIEVAIGFRF